MTEREIFLEAVEMSTPEARAAFLQDACGGNATLRHKVDELLKEHFSEDSLLAGPALGGKRGTIKLELAREAVPAEMLGRYKLLEKIGEGGFGEVWMAEQREPIKRRVALKILKPGMDSRQIVARFEAERQALAMMDHANIAKIFDAGRTDSGRPYFVMELVRGIKITDYCDQKQLLTEERLKLFILVCHAIQHAHQKGIIHRDIKPSNILVTLHDGVPVPKVIDFGIAKATQQELTDKTLFTQFQQFIGTPAYISPEAAEMSGLDIDTRADIYSLGVLLYELLVGQTPFDAKELIQGGLDALRQIIREKEPLRPSTKLNTLQGEARTTAGKSRQTDVGRLVHQLQGDLDWIVMKCLEKDRARRYETANALAADIRRHLDCEPVVARPPSRLYEFQKTVKRHKVGFVAAAAVILALAVGLGISTWTLVKEKQALARAVAAEKTAQGSATQAVEEAKRAENNAIEAREQRKQAETLAEQNRQNLYAARINQAWHVIQGGDVPRALELLESLVQGPGESDLRGFEWYYLWRLCHSEKFNLAGHVGPVRSVAFSPNGLTVASAGNDMIIRLWDTRTGKQRSAIEWPYGSFTSVAFSPDGKWLAAGSSNSTVGLWETETGKLRHTFEGHTNPVSVVKFSPDGSVLASATSEFATGEGNPTERFLGKHYGGIPGELKLWDLRTMQERTTFKGNKWGILDVAFSPDGNLVASGGMDYRVRIWKVSTQELVAVLTNTGPVFSLGFAPDSKELAAAGGYPHNNDSRIKFWDVRGFTEMSRLHEDMPLILSMSYTPDAKAIVCAGKNGIVYRLDLASGRIRPLFSGHAQFIRSIAVSPDGNTLASGDWAGAVKLWDTTKALETETFAGGETGSYTVAFSKDGTLLAIGGSGTELDGTRALGVWDVATGKQRLTGSMKSGDVIVAISGDGSTVAAAGTEGIIELWNLETGEHLRTITNYPGKTIWCMAFSPDSRMLASGSSTGVINLWDFRSGTLVAALERHTTAARDLAFTPDGKTLFSGGAHELKSWNMETLKVQKEIAGPNQVMEISPDGRLLASGHIEHGITIRRTSDLGELVTLRGHRENIWGIAFSPDSKTVATTGWDQTIRLWHAATGQELMCFTARRGVGWGVAFSPDSKFLAFCSGASGRGEVSLVRAATKTEVLPWETAELKKAKGK